MTQRENNKLLGVFYPNEIVLFLTFTYGVWMGVCNAICRAQGDNLLSSQTSGPLNKPLL